MSDPDDDGSMIDDSAPSGARRWLNRNVAGMGITSLLADVGYEMVTAVLPGFLAVIGAPPVVLGVMEGLADALSSFVKLAAGWWSDRIGRRKAIVVLGYLLTGTVQALFALAVTWPLVMAARITAWLGKGVRGPLRDAMLAESIAAGDRGKAFGFHRAADTIGAIAGPLLGAGLLSWLAARGGPSLDAASPYRTVFVLSLVPGVACALTFALMVRERVRPGNPLLRFWASLRALPVGFRRVLVGVGVFGAGDFSHTLLILAAVELLTDGRTVLEASAIGATLYALRNLVHALTSYPVGALSDRIGRRGLLVGGYLLGAAVITAFAVMFAFDLATVTVLAVLFALAGVFIAVEDALEGAITADLVPDESVRGTAYGVMGTVNSVGDLVSSAAVGALWVWSPVIGFGYAAVMMLLGAILLHRVR